MSNDQSFKNRKPGMGKAEPGTIKRIFSYIFQYKWRVVAIVICILIGAAAQAGSALFLQSLIDTYILPMVGETNPDWAPLLRAISLMGCLYLAGIVASWAWQWLIVTVEQGTLKKIRDDMFAHQQKLPIRYFDSHEHGDIMSHYTNDTDTLRQAISQSFPQMFSSIISALAALLSMLWLSIPFTAFVIVFTVLLYFIVRKIVSRSGRYFVKQQMWIGDVNAFVEESVNGQKVIKVSQQLTMVMMALAGASRIFKLMDEPVESDNGTVTLVNVELGEDGRTMREVDHETGHWAWKREEGDDGTRSLKAAEKLHGSAREVAVKAKEQAITSPDGRYTLLRGDVRFTNVTFGYNPDKPVLHDITWFAKPGQKIALVGATGAGKTTVTNLINRFYDIQQGQILYDGISVAGIKKPDLRRSLGIVLQDVNLFTGTVMDNIRYGRLNATDEECIEAARLVNADGFIRMLPKSYQTVLEGDGSGLSQGQRQLISIARAAVADPPALILDEATSSIDTRTEEVVQAGMDNLMKGRTVFVIAHRLSTVRNSDVIMVLDHGNIIERGSHDDLIAQRGEYYQLYTGAVELE